MKKQKKDKHFVKKPVYVGGLKAMREFISKELQYPKDALENKIEGTVRLRYDIDYKGKVTQVYILNGIGYGCNEEAERIIKKLKFKVEKTRKIKVVFHKDIQIHFRLPKVKKLKPTPKPVPKITQIQYNYQTVSSKKPNAQKSNKVPGVYTYSVNIKKR